MTDSLTLISAAKNTQTVLNFVSGNSLKQSISMVIGNVHIDAAKLALESSQIATNQRDRVNSAITHLEAAHVSFSKVHKKANNYLASSFDFVAIDNAANNDVWICSIMSLCYASLNEKYLVKKYIDLGTKALENNERAKGVVYNDGSKSDLQAGLETMVIGVPLIALRLAAALNPNTYILASKPLISDEDFQKFKSIISSTIGL